MFVFYQDSVFNMRKTAIHVKRPTVSFKYSRLSLSQLCITQYYRLSRLDGLVPVYSPIYYCNSTTFISTTAKSIKLITRYEKLVPLINFSVFYNAELDSIPKEKYNHQLTFLSERVSN